MKTFLAYIFLTIFSFQVLPVKELGKILFKGQMTEEIHEGDCCTSKIKKDSDPFRVLPIEIEQVARIQYSNSRAVLAVVELERFPKEHIPDIVTPPPNGC